MSATYITKDGDMVDHIAWRHYGHQKGTTVAIYEANPGLAARGMVLPAGVRIVLPDISPAEDGPTRGWD